MVDIFSDDENLVRFYEVHRNVRIIPKGLISYEEDVEEESF